MRNKFHEGDQDIDLGYMGNRDLPAPDAPRKYTPEQIEEVKKCAADVEYFAEKYFTIVHVDHGKMLIPLYDYQKRLLRKFQDHRFNIVTQARQSGKTTTATVYILHYILFNNDKNVAILANKGKTAKMILGRIKLAYKLLPNFLKEGVIEWNKNSIQLANGTKVEASATSADSISGDSISLLFIDEVAKIDNWDEFYSSTYPTIASGKDTKIIMVSTAKGLNHYYTLWQKALKGKNNFVPSEVTWREVPGRDEAWRKENIENTSEDQFMQEHENVFMGSVNTLIKMSKLRSLVGEDPYYNKNGLRLYNEPEKDHTYILCVDTGHGKGLDYSAFSVIDVTEYPFRQVATYRENDISPFVYPNIVLKVATQYNNAFVLVENNDMGAVVASVLNYDLEYENLINAKDDILDNSNKKYELGSRTTAKTKSIGCSELKELVEEERLIIQDEVTTQELMTFVVKNKSYAADKNCNDDTVMPLVMFSWFTTLPLFDEIFQNGQSIAAKLYRDRIEDAFEDLPPAGFIDDGINPVDFSATSDPYDFPDEKWWRM